jgi:hypothetical protein
MRINEGRAVLLATTITIMALQACREHDGMAFQVSKIKLQRHIYKKRDTEKKKVMEKE